MVTVICRPVVTSRCFAICPVPGKHPASIWKHKQRCTTRREGEAWETMRQLDFVQAWQDDTAIGLDAPKKELRVQSSKSPNKRLIGGRGSLPLLCGCGVQLRSPFSGPTAGAAGSLNAGGSIFSVEQRHGFLGESGDPGPGRQRGWQEWRLEAAQRSAEQGEPSKSLHAQFRSSLWEYSDVIGWPGKSGSAPRSGPCG